jgi:adhesin transport system membrane fusion protein
MREQVIQSLEGGILASIYVRQDDVVEPGQILAQLDPTLAASEVEESAAKLPRGAGEQRAPAGRGEPHRAYLCQGTRRPSRAEGGGDRAVRGAPQEPRSESLNWLEESLKNRAGRTRHQPVRSRGSAPPAMWRCLRLRPADGRAGAQEGGSEIPISRFRRGKKLAKANAGCEVAVAGSCTGEHGTPSRAPRCARRCAASSRISRSPPLAGVLSPNGKLMEIIPLDEQLLIEARMSPARHRLHPSGPARHGEDHRL